VSLGSKKTEKLEKSGNNGAKIFYKKLAFAMFATLTPHRQPTNFDNVNES